ncbi:MAG TPA: carbamoyltransferase HypF [Terriglobales bacterium]|jgi:hydrogenase maturation protein HypF
MAAHSSSLLARKRIAVSGVVQGVGFRPFVHNLAKDLGLTGYALNSSAGVVIEIEGADARIDNFLSTLRNSPPPLARIEEVTVSDVELNGDDSFCIRPSVSTDGEFALVSADVGTCKDCWQDFSDPSNRRYGYAFTNCTNCGPRYTIIQDVPYDRPATTMARFRMCPECQAEYDDPRDRRFHAQPNACPACGPQLTLMKSGERTGTQLSSLREVRNLLQQGHTVGVKGLGGFLLACNAENDAAVRRLRERKRRSDKPFALMAPDIPAIERFCIVSQADRKVLSSAQRPIVIMPRRSDAKISPAIAPGNNTLGVMLPYTPLHYLLFGNSVDESPEFSALVMTSGNFSEEPIVISNEEAAERLSSIADYFLFHDRDIYMRVDDSVVRSFEGHARVIRRSRGFAPEVIDLGRPVKEILACGAELKNTLCLTKGHYAILSQHIGDLENYETLTFFRETIENLKKVYRAEPKAVAYDLHPQYMSTRFALGLEIEEKIGVQHHHAHIASCMAENHLDGKVIGVAFDGTGFGTDGEIWGGEFLVAGFDSFERHTHLRYVPMPGGDMAVREPWRMGLSYLRDTFGERPLPEVSQFLQQIPEKQISIVDAMLSKGINTRRTSSCGRLFDAVASIIGLRNTVTFEGQAAIELEMAALDETSHYEFEIEDAYPAQIDVRPVIQEIVDDLSRRRSAGYIAARFHNTLLRIIVEVCRRIRKSESLDRVCLSGGTFQNHFLLRRVVKGLRQTGLKVFLHTTIPPNDGGIALGQAVIANKILQGGN